MATCNGDEREELISVLRFAYDAMDRAYDANAGYASQDAGKRLTAHDRIGAALNRVRSALRRADGQEVKP